LQNKTTRDLFFVGFQPRTYGLWNRCTTNWATHKLHILLSFCHSDSYCTWWEFWPNCLVNLWCTGNAFF